MGLLDRVIEVGGRANAAWRAFSGTAPTVEGLRPLGPQQVADRNPETTRILRSAEALFGRVSYGAGPSPTRYSTYPADAIDPARVKGIFRQADLGRPRLQAELYEQLIEDDGHTRAVAEGRIYGVTGKPWRLQAKNETALARSVAQFCRGVLDEIDAFDQALETLLWANGYGYAACEIVWGFRRIRFPLPGGTPASLEGVVPISLEWVHGKHFEFDQTTDEPYLFVDGGNQTLPPAKFVFHRAGGSGLVERRGYMRACSKLIAAKRWAWRDWLNYCHIYGVPQLRGVYQGDITEYGEHRDLYEAILRDFGQGIPAIHPDTFKIEIDNPPPGGKANDPQAAMIGWANSEISKLIQHETLTTETGVTGSYNMAETHADVKHAVLLADTRKLARTVRADLLTPIVELNLDVLASAFGEPAEAILQVVPTMMWILDRYTTPSQRMTIVSQAVNDLGMELDEEQFRDEFGLDAPRPGSKPLSGKPMSIGTGGVVGSLEASKEGAEPPPKEAAVSVETAAPAAVEESEKGEGDAKSVATITLTPSDIATIVTVNEARRSQGLPPLPGEDGTLTVAEYKAKHSETVSEAAAATEGEAHIPRG